MLVCLRGGVWIFDQIDTRTLSFPDHTLFSFYDVVETHMFASDVMICFLFFRSTVLNVSSLPVYRVRVISIEHNVLLCLTFRHFKFVPKSFRGL